MLSDIEAHNGFLSEETKARHWALVLCPPIAMPYTTVRYVQLRSFFQVMCARNALAYPGGTLKILNAQWTVLFGFHSVPVRNRFAIVLHAKSTLKWGTEYGTTCGTSLLRIFHVLLFRQKLSLALLRTIYVRIRTSPQQCPMSQRREWYGTAPNRPKDIKFILFDTSFTSPPRYPPSHYLSTPGQTCAAGSGLNFEPAGGSGSDS